MRQIVQLEGSTWCGAINACMVLDHFGLTYDLDHAKRRFAAYDKQKVETYEGTRGDMHMAAYLTEVGMIAFLVKMGTPYMWNEEHSYYQVSHKPREARVATWYRAYELLRQGFVAVVSHERDAGKYHFVCVDDAFLRNGERWFSIWCSIRGHYEEQADRFLLSPSGQGAALEWTFAKPMTKRFASAAEFAAERKESDALGDSVSPEPAGETATG